MNVDIDVIFVSYAYSSSLRQLTIDCIKSLLSSEDSSAIRFNVVVLESKKELAPYQYPDSTTIYPEQPFGFHRYMNIGITATHSQYVCLCNNDLVFHKGWASEIINLMQIAPEIMSASPICSLYHPRIGIALNSGNFLSYRVGFELAGWCLFVNRLLFKKIGKLDENYVFSASDNDYANTLRVCNIKHVLVTSSIVDHLQGQTLLSQNSDTQDALMRFGTYYTKKWNSRIGDLAYSDLIAEP